MTIAMKSSDILKSTAAALLSIAVFSGLLPQRTVNAAVVELFVEDFEGYEVGTIVEAESDQTTSTKVGNIEYQLCAGDMLEIAEEDGNKYLKITRPSESSNNSHIKYNFPETFSDGVYSVSYDFRPDLHNRHFARFGSLIREGGTVNIATLSYGNNVYAHNSTDANYYIGNLIKSENYTDSEYATVTQTIDLTSANDNYTFKAYYPNSSGGYATATKTNTANQLGIAGLAWAIKKHTTAGYNGPDDASAAAVYRIDNIKVTMTGLLITETNITDGDTVSANSDAEITFDAALANDAAGHIKVFENDEELSSNKYSSSLSNDKTKVTISGFSYNSDYKIKVDKGLKSSDGVSMTEAWEISFKTDSIISHGITKQWYEEGFIPYVYPLSGINYEYQISKDGTQYEDYDLSPINSKGSYKLKITATDENGKQQTETVEFEIVGAEAPKALDVQIVFAGPIGEDTELSGQYTYFDANDTEDENMDHCTYQWYRSNEENGVYVPIYGATEASYRLTADDEDKYIRLGVKPYSKVEPKEGEEALSSAFAGFVNPEACNLLIEGIPAPGEKLELKYDYKDPGGDTEVTEGENATRIIWYISDTADGEYSKVATGRKGEKYKVRKEDENKWLKACVIPKNSINGRHENSFYSYSVKITAKGDFSEDFEDYDVGVIAEGEKNTISTERNPGGLLYKTVTGDKLEIVEKDGSKVLKLTAKKDDKNERRVILDFDRHYGDNRVYDVDFDYCVESNSVWFNDFGTLCDDELGGNLSYVHETRYNPIKLISSYRNNLYFDGRTGDDIYIGSELLTPDGVWKHQNENIDFSQHPTPFKITITRKSDGEQLASKKAELTYTYGGAADEITADNVSSIAWRFKTNSTQGWNGQSEGEGIYYIDNITLKSAGVSVTDARINDGDVVFDFDEAVAADSAKAVSVVRDGEIQPADDYSVAVEGEKITVSGLDYNSYYEVKVNNTLRSQSGKQLLSEYAIGFRSKSLIDYESVSGRHRQGYIPVVPEADGITYSYFISKDESDFIEYTQTPLDETGQYSLMIVAYDADGKFQTEIADLEIVGPVAPEARNVRVEADGTLDVGTVLRGTYTYFDVNDDIPDINKAEGRYQWYRSDSENGEFEPINGANAITYKLTEDDEDKYIKFGVRPFSKIEPKVGEEYKSEAFMSFMDPKASNIKISGTMATDEQLTVSYDYSDLNGDEEITEGENATVVIWYTSKVKGGTYGEVGRGTSYRITEADSDKWFKVGVIPKNAGGGSRSKVYWPEEIQGAFSPVITDVRLIGNANINSTLSVDYKFYDANQDIESGSTVEWFVGGTSVSHDAYYTVGSNDQGKTIYAIVTPRSSAKPDLGIPAKSDSKVVSRKTNTAVTGSGGGGGGGGGGSYAGGASSGGTGNNITPPSDNSGQDNNSGQGNNSGTAADKSGFKDIAGHWAEAAILKMVEQGIILGRSDDEFAPEDDITRAEFAALLTRMFDLTGDGYKFNDVAADSWYSSSVSAVAAAGYMTGAFGDFRPEDKITREEMAVAISAVTSAHGIEADGTETGFTDFDAVSDWAKKAVGDMAAIGIINGMEDNSFVPKGKATRAQTVMMLTRLQDALSGGN